MKFSLFSDNNGKIAFPKLSLPFGKNPKRSLQSTCGLDIGNHSVKWLELQGDEQLEVVGFNLATIDKERGRHGVLIALREAVKGSGGGTTRRIYGSLSGHSVIARYVHFPRMTRDELYSHIEVEADKYIPFNIKDVILDCYILEERKEDGKIHALVVAVKKDVVQNYLTLLQEAGLELDALDVDTFALVNAFVNAFENRTSSSQYHALLDIGGRTTNITILHGKTCLFCRDVQVGGTDFTQAISEQLKLEMDAAEMVKCSGDKSQEELLKLIESPLESLVNEARISFDYFENQYNGRPGQIYVSGGSSRLPGLLSYLQSNFSIETQAWDPLEGFTVAKHIASKVRDSGAGLAVAVGLALRGKA
ncbi:MAG: type IV pilus assembly protein PilM [Candidatus Omnitrophota bacterium]